MTELLQIYKCNICGNIVEVVHPGAGTLSCCEQPMALMKENTMDAATEKHVPVVTTTERDVTVRVGAVPHPMEEKHYIEWIEVIAGDEVYRRFLKPGQAAEARFALSAKTVSAREYCNIHGLWKS